MQTMQQSAQENTQCIPVYKLAKACQQCGELGPKMAAVFELWEVQACAY